MVNREERPKLHPTQTLTSEPLSRYQSAGVGLTAKTHQPMLKVTPPLRKSWIFTPEHGLLTAEEHFQARHGHRRGTTAIQRIRLGAAPGARAAGLHSFGGSA